MADELPLYTAWMRKRDCCVCGGPGPCHAHHHTEGDTVAPGDRRPTKNVGTKRGRGQRAHDYFCMPVHTKCHAQLHEFRGPFKGMDQAQRRAWQDEQVYAHRAAYDRENETAPTPGAERKVQRTNGVEARLEELVQLYGPENGQFRFDLKRYTRFVAEETKAGRF